jgi:hypothetical protein
VSEQGGTDNPNVQQSGTWKEDQNHQQPSQEEEELRHFLSTPEEVKRAVERNAIDRGVLFIGIIVELRIDDLLSKVEKLAGTTDKEEIAESASQLGIREEALKLLDGADPPIPYPYYFSTPGFLTAHPELAFYYRNIAMLSAKVMRGIDLDTSSYESGEVPTHKFFKSRRSVIFPQCLPIHLRTSSNLPLLPRCSQYLLAEVVSFQFHRSIRG